MTMAIFGAKEMHASTTLTSLSESAKGLSIWLTLFDLLDVDANNISVMHESMQMHKLDTLVGTRVSLTIKKSKRNCYTNYIVTNLAVLH